MIQHTEHLPCYRKDHNFLPLGFQLINLMNFSPFPNLSQYLKSKQPKTHSNHRTVRSRFNYAALTFTTSLTTDLEINEIPTQSHVEQILTETFFIFVSLVLAFLIVIK